MLSVLSVSIKIVQEHRKYIYKISQGGFRSFFLLVHAKRLCFFVLSVTFKNDFVSFDKDIFLKYLCSYNM